MGGPIKIGLMNGPTLVKGVAEVRLGVDNSNEDVMVLHDNHRSSSVDVDCQHYKLKRKVMPKPGYRNGLKI